MKLTHNTVSYIKSVVRILAGAALIVTVAKLAPIFIAVAGVLFIVAELLGILEEIV